MSSYTCITFYRSRTGKLMAHAETSAGLGKPVRLSGAGEVNASIVARACGARLPATVAEHCMTRDELARGCAEVVAKLKGGS